MRNSVIFVYIGLNEYQAVGEEADSPPCSINLPSRILSNDKTLNENRTHTRAHTHTLILQHTHIHACTHTHAHLQINHVLTLGTTNFMCVLYDLRMCMHGYTHTHTHTHKQTHTQTHT